MLHINHLSISFDNKSILDDISLHLQTGQIACLLGASGCGKTTMLRCIAGFETPNQGSIQLNENILFDKQHNTPAHLRNIGMVFQDYALFPHLTVAQNIAFGLKNLTKSQQNERIEEMLQLIGMCDYKNSYPHELSGGQQQRIALVRALAPKPKLILLDEPFSNLDVELRSSLSKEVRRLLKSQNVGAILVTHDQAEAFVMADVIGMIFNGKLQQWDSPTNLYHHPKTKAVAQFIGEGVLYDIDHISNNDVHFALGQIKTKQAPHATAKQILIRPHDVRTSTDEHAIKMQVVDKDFRGSYWSYILENQEKQRLLMQISMSYSHTLHEVGDEIFVEILNASFL